MSIIADFVGALGADLIAPRILTLLRGLGKAAVPMARLAAPMAKEMGEKALKDVAERQKNIAEYRDEVIAYITRLGSHPGASRDDCGENILRRIAARDHLPYLPGDENALVGVLVDVYRHLSDPSEENDRFEFFVYLDSVTDEEFDNIVNALTHDHWTQLLKRGWVLMKLGGGHLNREVNASLDEVENGLDAFEAWVNRVRR